MWSHFYQANQDASTPNYVDFSSIRVAGMLRLDETTFEDEVSLLNAQVDDVVNCHDAHFCKWVRFVQARIGESLNLHSAHFDRGLRLNGTKIEGTVDASKVTMVNGLECDNVKVGGRVTFEDAEFTYSENKQDLQENTFR